MFVSLRRTQTWRLHTKLYKFGWHTSSNNTLIKNSKDLILGKVVYISIIYCISDSWLFSLNGYDFYFDHTTGEKRENFLNSYESSIKVMMILLDTHRLKVFIIDNLQKSSISDLTDIIIRHQRGPRINELHAWGLAAVNQLCYELLWTRVHLAYASKTWKTVIIFVRLTQLITCAPKTINSSLSPEPNTGHFGDHAFAHSGPYFFKLA